MFIESLHCEVWFRLLIDGISLNADLNISNFISSYNGSHLMDQQSDQILYYSTSRLEIQDILLNINCCCIP